MATTILAFPHQEDARRIAEQRTHDRRACRLAEFLEALISGEREPVGDQHRLLASMKRREQRAAELRNVERQP